MRDASTVDFSSLVLGESGEPVEVNTSEQCRQAVVSMVRQSRNAIDIASRDLDPPIYDNEELAELIKQVLLGNQRARLRILVQDVSRVTAYGHRLVTLAQRLATFTEIRVPTEEHAQYNSALFIADGTGVLYRSLADRYGGMVNFNDRGLAEQMRRTFEEMWPTARPDPNLRALHI